LPERVLFARAELFRAGAGFRAADAALREVAALFCTAAALFREAPPPFAADRFAGAAFRAPLWLLPPAAPAVFPPRAELTTFRAFPIATFAWRCTPATVRRTTRRTARLGAAVCSTASVAAVPALAAAVVAASLTRPAALVAAEAAELAAVAAACAVSTTVRVAFPSVLPTRSAACVTMLSSSCVPNFESSAIASPRVA
jgi:hypothetical protein